MSVDFLCIFKISFMGGWGKEGPWKKEGASGEARAAAPQQGRLGLFP